MPSSGSSWSRRGEERRRRPIFRGHKNRPKTALPVHTREAAGGRQAAPIEEEAVRDPERAGRTPIDCDQGSMSSIRRGGTTSPAAAYRAGRSFPWRADDLDVPLCAFSTIQRTIDRPSREPPRVARLTRRSGISARRKGRSASESRLPCRRLDHDLAGRRESNRNRLPAPCTASRSQDVVEDL